MLGGEWKGDGGHNGLVAEKDFLVGRGQYRVRRHVSGERCALFDLCFLAWFEKTQRQGKHERGRGSVLVVAFLGGGTIELDDQILGLKRVYPEKHFSGNSNRASFVSLRDETQSVSALWDEDYV